MSLKNIPGQTRARRFLKQLMLSGHVPHALLFSGMAGIGKADAAREFAKLLNCREVKDADACDRCIPCRKIAGDFHPDFYWVRSEGAFIKLEQIRELRKRVRFRPFEGSWRVIVMENAHKLREEAANALLKILEEPPAQNLFILLTLEPQMLLPTIVSRCCHVRFQPLEDHLIEDQLLRAHSISSDRAKEIARLAEGSMERARWLAEEDRIMHWQEVLANIRKLRSLSMMEFFELTARWSQKSEDLEQDFECIKLWLRDVILSRLIHDYRPAFLVDTRSTGMEEVSLEQLFRLYDQIEEAVQHLRRNANKQLTLEGVCLAIKDYSNGQGSRHPFSQGR
jgi:DNA polymerase III subunit delta'